MQFPTVVRIIFLSIYMISCSLGLMAQPSEAALGLWLTDEGESHVKIFRDGEEFKGKIVWLRNPKDDRGQPVTDDNGDPVLNMVFMTEFVYEDGEYVDGKVYNPKTGKTYYGSMELDGKNVLKLRGSLDQSGWFGRTETWTRVKE